MVKNDGKRGMRGMRGMRGRKKRKMWGNKQFVFCLFFLIFI
jgi:hypothetical protein